MLLRRLTVRLPEELIASLDAHAVWRGVSRTDLVGQALRSYLDGPAEIDTAIVEGYRRIPAGEPDEWTEAPQHGSAQAGNGL